MSPLSAAPRLGILLSLALGLAALVPPAHAAAEAARAFVDRLAKNGRAEAALERVAVDPLSGRTQRLQGRIVLEPPDRARFDFGSGGERITLRGDGGEWLQPSLRQMLVLGPERAALARGWWDALLAPDRAGVEQKRLGPGRYLFTRRGDSEAAADTAWVWLDAAGSPSRIEIQEDLAGRTVYRLSGWRFGRALGRKRFVLEPPAGFEVVALP